MLNWATTVLDENHLDDQIGLPAARCRWQAKDDAKAAQDFKSVLGQSDLPMPDNYLRECYEAASLGQQ